MANGDFHLHSNTSDGVLSPSEVIRSAAKNGVQHLALTDHDSTEGLKEAAIAAEPLALQLICGIELSVVHLGTDIHILGYGFTQQFQPLQEYLQEQRDGRYRRMKKILNILNEYGLAISEDEILMIAGEGSIGRPHIARALIAKGYVSSVQEAFDKWLGDGKPADIQRQRLLPAEAISLIHEAEGLAFIAHPIFVGNDYEIAVHELALMGLDGIETYYKHYTEETIKKHQQLGLKLSLISSGGSDYHGLGNPDDREIGDIPFPNTEIITFLESLERADLPGLSLARANK